MEKIVVEIPIIAEHCGFPGYLRKLKIHSLCPKCGKKRAIKRWKGFSYDGSRRLVVDCWRNECEHIDKYLDVIKENDIEIIKEVK